MVVLADEHVDLAIRVTLWQNDRPNPHELLS
jgi:hypothetical protein